MNAPVLSDGIVVSVYARTDVGMRRQGNEDSFLVADLTTGRLGLGPEVTSHQLGVNGSLMVVSDGLGGAAAGEVASAMAVQTVCTELMKSAKSVLSASDRLKRATELANEQIWTCAQSDNSLRGMGATLTAAYVFGNSVYIAQVGDSRAYILRGGQVKQVTEDQSWANAVKKAGLETTDVPNNVILQALGTQPRVHVEVTSVDLRSGDMLLMCSDGLSNKIKDNEMREIVGVATDLPEGCRQLVDLANKRGGEDNITVIIAKFISDTLAASLEQHPSITSTFKIVNPLDFNDGGDGNETMSFRAEDPDAELIGQTTSNFALSDQVPTLSDLPKLPDHLSPAPVKPEQVTSPLTGEPVPAKSADKWKSETKPQVKVDENIVKSTMPLVPPPPPKIETKPKEKTEQSQRRAMAETKSDLPAVPLPVFDLSSQPPLPEPPKKPQPEVKIEFNPTPNVVLKVSTPPVAPPPPKPSLPAPPPALFAPAPPKVEKTEPAKPVAPPLAPPLAPPAPSAAPPLVRPAAPPVKSPVPAPPVPPVLTPRPAEPMAAKPPVAPVNVPVSPIQQSAPPLVSKPKESSSSVETVKVKPSVPSPFQIPTTPAKPPIPKPSAPKLSGEFPLFNTSPETPATATRSSSDLLEKSSPGLIIPESFKDKGTTPLPTSLDDESEPIMLETLSMAAPPEEKASGKGDGKPAIPALFAPPPPKAAPPKPAVPPIAPPPLVAPPPAMVPPSGADSAPGNANSRSGVEVLASLFSAAPPAKGGAPIKPELTKPESAKPDPLKPAPPALVLPASPKKPELGQVAAPPLKPPPPAAVIPPPVGGASTPLPSLFTIPGESAPKPTPPAKPDAGIVPPPFRPQPSKPDSTDKLPSLFAPPPVQTPPSKPTLPPPPPAQNLMPPPAPAKDAVPPLPTKIDLPPAPRPSEQPVQKAAAAAPPVQKVATAAPPVQQSVSEPFAAPKTASASPDFDSPARSGGRVNKPSSGGLNPKAVIGIAATVIVLLVGGIGFFSFSGKGGSNTVNTNPPVNTPAPTSAPASPTPETGTGGTPTTTGTPTAPPVNPVAVPTDTPGMVKYALNEVEKTMDQTQKELAETDTKESLLRRLSAFKSELSAYSEKNIANDDARNYAESALSQLKSIRSQIDQAPKATTGKKK